MIQHDASNTSSSSTRAPAHFTGPRSILRVMQIFTQLATQPDGQTLTQLCQSLALPKTSLHTMLKVLESADYLGNDGGVYRLGPQAVALGALMAESPRSNFPACANGILQSLVRRTGETGYLAVLTEDRRYCRYIAAIETENWLRFSVQVDSQKPSYATGSGRAMLAYLPLAEVEQLLDTVSFERITAKTVSSRRALLASLQEVRKHGVSAVDSGTVPGVIAIAAPIFDADGKVMAAVTVGGPTARLAERLQDVQDNVRDAAESISRVMGYRAEWPPSRAR